MRKEDQIKYWQKMIEKHAASGLSAAAFCRKQNLSIHQFHWWRRRFRKKDAQGKASGFLKLLPISISQQSGIHIRLNEGVFIEVDPGFDPHTLRRVIEAIGGEGRTTCSP